MRESLEKRKHFKIVKFSLPSLLLFLKLPIVYRDKHLLCIRWHLTWNSVSVSWSKRMIDSEIAINHSKTMMYRYYMCYQTVAGLSLWQEFWCTLVRGRSLHHAACQSVQGRITACTMSFKKYLYQWKYWLLRDCSFELSYLSMSSPNPPWPSLQSWTVKSTVGTDPNRFPPFYESRSDFS